MAEALFINESYLKANTPLSGNVDMGEIYPFAKSAEEMYVQEAIGTALFDRLVESLNASPVNTTANEIVLLKKIRPMLMWYTLYDALPFLAIKIRNIGLVKQTGTNLESVSQDDVTYLRDQCYKKAKFYENLLQKYLCEYSDLFQEYCCANWNCSQIMPNTNVSNTSDLAIDRNDRDIHTEFVRKWLNDR